MEVKKMEMTPVLKCGMSTCAYNKRNICHTWGINVGPHAECSTFTHASARGGYNEVKGAIGACQAADCKFNNQLECVAPDINVSGHDRHADCERYQAKS